MLYVVSFPDLLESLIFFQKVTWNLWLKTILPYNLNGRRNVASLQNLIKKLEIRDTETFSARPETPARNLPPTRPRPDACAAAASFPPRPRFHSWPEPGLREGILQRGCEGRRAASRPPALRPRFPVLTARPRLALVSFVFFTRRPRGAAGRLARAHRRSRTPPKGEPEIPRIPESPGAWDHQAVGGINPAAEAPGEDEGDENQVTQQPGGLCWQARLAPLAPARGGRGFRHRPPYPSRRLVGAGTGGRKQPRPQPDRTGPGSSDGAAALPGPRRAQTGLCGPPRREAQAATTLLSGRARLPPAGTVRPARP